MESRAPPGKPDGARVSFFRESGSRRFRSAACYRYCGDALQVADARALQHPLDPGVDVVAVIAEHVDADLVQDQHPWRKADVGDREIAGEKIVALQFVIEVVEHALDRLMQPLHATLVALALGLGHFGDQLADWRRERGVGEILERSRARAHRT